MLSTTVPKIGPAETDPSFIHGLTEKTSVVENDECVIWDSVTGTLMKCKKSNLGIPPGTIIDWAGNEPNMPAGYLLCDGKSYLKTTYPALATALGTIWGAGDATHFVVPDLRGYVTAGRDNMGGTDANRLSHGRGGGNNAGRCDGKPDPYPHGCATGIART